MSKNTLLFFVLAISLYGCSRTKPAAVPLIHEAGKPVQLHLTDTGTHNNNLAQLLTPQTFIGLQVPANETLSGIDQVLAYKDQLICVDRKFSSLLVFDSTGRFIKKIGRLGKGPGKYLSIEDVFVDEASGRLTVFSNTSQSLTWFSLNDSSTGSTSLPFNAWRCVPVDSGYAFYLNYLGILNNPHNLFITNREGNIVKEDLPYPPEIKMAFGMAGTMTPSGPGYLVNTAFSDTIYYGTYNTLTPAYTLGLGNRQIPVSAMLNTAALNQAGANGTHIGITMTDLPQALFFEYTDKMFVKYGAYNKKTGQLYTSPATPGNALSLFFKAPAGYTADGRLISFIQHEAIPYYQERYPAFMEEVKTNYPALHTLLQQPAANRQPILAIYSVHP